MNAEKQPEWAAAVSRFARWAHVPVTNDGFLLLVWKTRGILRLHIPEQTLLEAPTGRLGRGVRTVRVPAYSLQPVGGGEVCFLTKEPVLAEPWREDEFPLLGLKLAAQ